MDVQCTLAPDHKGMLRLVPILLARSELKVEAVHQSGGHDSHLGVRQVLANAVSRTKAERFEHGLVVVEVDGLV